MTVRFRELCTAVCVSVPLIFPATGIGNDEQKDRRSETTTAKLGQRDVELAAPVRIEADGEPIDIGKLSSYAHAGPWVADVDGDGDRDLLVGDFPGYFWFFENTDTDEEPMYRSKGKLQAGDAEVENDKDADHESEPRAVYEAVMKEYQALSTEYQELEKKKQSFYVESRRASFIWLYLRTGGR